MKKFLTRLLLILLCTVGPTAVFCMISDPFNVFHCQSIRTNGIEPNRNYIKMEYVLNNKDKFDSYLFGSSRVSSIHTNNIYDKKAYNMSYSEGLPAEHLNNIKTLIENGEIPETIYLGVDSLSYTINPKDHLHEPARMPYEYAKKHPLSFYGTYLDPALVLSSDNAFAFRQTLDEEERQRFYEYGFTYDYNHPISYDFSEAEAVIGNDLRTDETIEDIKEIKRICEENDIELIVFTNPMYYLSYRESLNTGYEEFLRNLVSVSDFYNFSGYNHVTVNPYYYVDSSHYNAEVGDMIIDVICFDAYYEWVYHQGFGWHVTEDNIDELLIAMNTYRFE